MKKYSVKPPYQKTGKKNPFKIFLKIFPSRETSSKLEHRNVSGKKGKHN